MTPEEHTAFRIEQFVKFYNCLMKDAPKKYNPWFFPCEKNNKNPCTGAIYKLNPKSKGSWHDESARLNKEQCVEHIKQGYNIGISARIGDPLIIIDIDEEKYLEQVPKKTLTATSRKRAGVHAFCWDEDGSAKINLPVDAGEVRSENQYVLACGSYTPFNIKDKKEEEKYNSLPNWAREDKELGYYTIRDEVSPRPITFNGLPEFFKKGEEDNVEKETEILQREEKKTYTDKEGKYTELFKLKVSDIIGVSGANKRMGHPLHESDTDANWSLSKDGTIGHCWRHLVSLNAVQYLCVKTGYAKCQDAGTPHKGRGISKIRGDKKAFDVAYSEALDMELITEWKKPVSDFSNKIGNAFDKKDLAQRIIDVQPCYYDRSRNWWLWDSEETKWERVDETDILNAVDEQATINTINSKEKNEMLEALKQVSRLNAPLPIKTTWIQFKNIIIDIETGEKFPAESKYFVTNPIPWVLNKEGISETPVMDKIFEEWVGKEHIQTLYEILAYCLIPDYPVHRIFCFIGGGMNGKSCFLNLLRKFIGGDNCCSTELDTLLQSRFEVTRLHKKLVCQMGETNFSEMNKTSVLKKLSGGDLIGFEYKNKDPFQEINYAKIIIATNNLPATNDKTIGFYRRWMIIDFPNQFSEKKDILLDIPEEEYKSLALRCSLILKDLLKTRTFTNEGSVEDRMKKYEDHSNPLEKFLREFTEETYDGVIWKHDFSKKLNSWCKENRFREISDVHIGKKMKDLGISQSLRTAPWDITKKCRAWIGIKLSEEQVEQEEQA